MHEAKEPAVPLESPTDHTSISIDDLHSLTAADLHERLNAWNVRVNPDRTRRHLVLDLMKAHCARQIPVQVEGILEMADEHHGYLRWPRYSFRAGPEDIYISSAQVRQYGLRNGQRIQGEVRSGRDQNRFLLLDSLTAIEGVPVAEWSEKKHFDLLTPLFPTERIILESPTSPSLSARAVDLIAPLGYGQRGLLVASPRTGKTILLKNIAQAIRANFPATKLIILLVDERPEEVTDFQRSVDAEIYSSTFDEAPKRHVQVAELVSDRAKRLVENGENVIILLDSITRLARGYNALQPNKGRAMSGGVDSKALLKPKKFFGAARNVEEGGSLTILATALVDTQSRMDEVIFEEFKGTGNMEAHLDRTLSDKRVFPAIHVLMSATRRDELLYHPAEFERVQILRKQLAALPHVEAMELLLKNLKATQSNAELLMAGLRG